MFFLKLTPSGNGVEWILDDPLLTNFVRYMCCLFLFDFVDGGVVFMSKRKSKSNTSVSNSIASGDTSEYVSELECKVCKEPIEFYSETKTKKRKATTYEKHCKPHLECIRQRLCERKDNISELCRAFKFNRTTFYKWIDKHAELKEIIDESEQIQVEFLEENLMSFASDRNPKTRSGAVRSCEILLKAKAPDKYADRVKADVTGEVDYNLSMNSIINRKRAQAQKKKAEAGE